MIREIHTSAITDAVKKLCMEANYELEPDMLRAFDRALTTERSPAGPTSRVNTCALTKASRVEPRAD